jgi:glutamyl-tRNA synthetase
MIIDKVQHTATIYALQNAVQFEGKATEKAVIGKVIAALRKEGIPPKDIIPVIHSVVEEVNSFSLEEQVAKLEQLAPDLLVKEKKKRDFSLPPLPDAEKGKVVTRFPPEPNGYLHIGHAKAAIVDHEYARRYEGRFLLRFDDTNPENAQLEFYEAQKEDLRWLGIDWDEEYRTSDHLEMHYRLAEQLIQQGDAYVCTCESEKIKECRFQGIECACRHQEDGNSLDLWKEMVHSSLEGAILRLKGEMCCDNTAMRDPTLFRIIEYPHPIYESKYRVWPTYDFAGAVEDSLSGVTHPFRTKEYELRDECYFRLLDLLHLRHPHLMEFARLSIEGMPVSKRKIKPLIDQGIVKGYDDVRLPTLRGLRKRGIVPQAIKQFVLSQGISKVESTVTFSLVEAENRKIVDPLARRYFFVANPVHLQVRGAPIKEKTIRLHPTNDALGSRTLKTGSSFFVQREDINGMKLGDIFRLKDLFNVRLVATNGEITGEYAGEELLSESPKIQWTLDKKVEMTVYVPHLLYKDEQVNPDSLTVVEGYAEEAVSQLQPGDIIQFERFGFVRIDRENDRLIGYFSHK